MPNHAAKSVKGSFSPSGLAVQQRSMAGGASAYVPVQLSAYQQMADNSSRLAQLKGYQGMAGSMSAQVIQMARLSKHNGKVGPGKDEVSSGTGKATTQGEFDTIIRENVSSDVISTYYDLRNSVKKRNEEMAKKGQDAGHIAWLAFEQQLLAIIEPIAQPLIEAKKAAELEAAKASLAPPKVIGGHAVHAPVSTGPSVDHKFNVDPAELGDRGPKVHIARVDPNIRFISNRTRDESNRPVGTPA